MTLLGYDPVNFNQALAQETISALYAAARVMEDDCSTQRQLVTRYRLPAAPGDAQAQWRGQHADAFAAQFQNLMLRATNITADLLTLVQMIQAAADWALTEDRRRQQQAAIAWEKHLLQEN